MLGVVSPVLHNKLPVAVVESTELPQLSATVIVGVAGIAFGVATAVPSKLSQPFTVVFTL